jgi:hypothetical protein
MIKVIKGESLTYRLRGFSVVYAVIGALWIWTSTTLVSIFIIYGILIFALGIIAGIASGYYFEKRELKIIKEKGETKLATGTTLLVLLILIGIFALSWMFWPQLGLFATQTKTIAAALQVFVGPALPAFGETQIYVIKKWQSLNQSEVLTDTGFFSGRIYAIPKQT